MLVRASTLIPSAPQALWETLVRWEDQAGWMPDAESVRVMSLVREGTGVRLAVRTRVLNVPLFTEQLEVTLWDPPRRLVIAHRSFVRGIGIWALTPEGASTRLVWMERIALPVPLLGELALLAYRPVLARTMRRALETLRTTFR